MNHSTGTPNKYQRERIEAMLRLGCVPCAQLGFWVVPEVQHIVQGNKRMGHWFTLPICPGHHRGVWSPEQVEIIPPDMRVAISDGSKAFEKLYGSQRDMWMKVQVRLKLPAIWPLSKILPRRLGHVESNKNLVAMAQSESLVPARSADIRGAEGSGECGEGSAHS